MTDPTSKLQKAQIAPPTLHETQRTLVDEQEGGELDHLRHVIDRDRYIVAAGTSGIKRAIAGRAWLMDGRGSYAWDDEEFRMEFAAALREIEAALKPLEIVAWDKSDCTRLEERVVAAKMAAKELMATPHGPREMIETDFDVDPALKAAWAENADLKALATRPASTQGLEERINGDLGDARSTGAANFTDPRHQGIRGESWDKGFVAAWEIVRKALADLAGKGASE